MTTIESLDGTTLIEFVLSLLLCVTIMLAAGIVAAWALRRRPARAHAALVLALVAALVTPFAAAAARQAGVGLLPAKDVVITKPTPRPRPVRFELDESDAGAGVLSGSMRVWLNDPFIASLPTETIRSELEQSLRMGPDFVQAVSSIPDQPWAWFSVLMWASMSIVAMTRTVLAAFIARRIVSRASDTAPEFLRAAAALAAGEVGLKREPLVRVSPRVASPVVWCWRRRPVIVVPPHAAPDVDWTAVMRHELAHWVRRDHLADALARLVIALVPIHPLAWAARGYLERLAERACDDWAVSGGERVSYAQSLVTLAARMRGPRVALPVARQGSDLAARVRRVLNLNSALPRIGRNWLIAGVATASCATALVALARQPLGEVKVLDPKIALSKADAERLERWMRYNRFNTKQPVAANVPGRAPPVIGPDVDITSAVKMVYDELAKEAGGPVFTLADAIADRNDARAIPLLIGVIDSDNTYWSIYGIGYFAMSRLTGVQYDDRYDGTWWRAWWGKNKANYPSAAGVQIPTFPPTAKRIAQVYDFGEWVGLTKGEPAERLVKEMERRLRAPDRPLSVSDLSARLSREYGARAIPMLIGVVDSDNTYETIYGVGAFGLGKITGVPYDDRHDGPWWRAWWEKNQATFPLDAQQTPIPELAKSPNYVASVYDHGRWIGEVDAEPVSRMMDELKKRIETEERNAHSIAQQIAVRNDPSVIPAMIAIIQADKGGRAKYDVGYFGLSPLTGVEYEEDHDGAWWVKWWDENKGRFAGRASAELPKVTLQAPPPRAEPGDNDAAADVRDVPNTDISIGGDANKRYFLIGMDNRNAAKESVGLLIILPGGDGSADFNPFIRRIWQNALPKGFVVAQAVAPKWRDGDDRVVWPTEKLPDEKMKFSTEQFIEEIVKDVKSRANIDPEKVFAFGWSSSGPPVYAATMRGGSSIKGAFVAMSVYHPETLPEPKGLTGKSFYIFHSPQDFIKMNFPRQAVEQLSAGGARATLVEYEGGHGWKGDIWKNIRTGVQWLMAKDEAGAGAAKPSSGAEPGAVPKP